MKREILFRGKKQSTGEWVYGSLITNENPGLHTIAQVNTNPVQNGVLTGWCFGVLPETVGQFTGLTDKNGKQIFEGDLLYYKEFYNTGMDLSHEEREIFTIEELKGKQRKETITPIEWIDAAFLIKTTRKEDDFDCMADILSGDQRHQQPITEAVVIGNIHDNPELS